jgi:glucose/arabinose dehydrogenase
MSPKSRACRAAVVSATVCLVGFVSAVPAGAITLPPDFVAENAAPGVAWNTPVNLAFLPDGRMLVAEKRGRVYIVTNGVRNSTPIWSREAEVLNNGDRGLLSIAVDPNFATNRFVYFLYTVDADSNNSDSSEDGFGRLTRYALTTGNPPVVDPASRTILMGVNWPNGPLSASTSHTVGQIKFGTDGSLIVTNGDGAQFNTTDAGGNDAGAFGTGKTSSLEDIGAFRSQYLPSLAGKVLRINPANGQGYPSNPFWNGNASSVQSRIWAYGVRNSYRFDVRPGTGSANPADGDPGTLYIGEVGWDLWEEINICHGGENFGWPCYEGVGPNANYQAATPARADCSTIGTPSNPSSPTAPIMTWHHSNTSISIPPGITGQTATGGVFYTGTRYPSSYLNRFFFADYTDDWIRIAEFDGADQYVSFDDFAFSAGGPVAFAVDPISTDVYYVAINQGQVTHLRYTGTTVNSPPVAVASASPGAGIIPLTVDFSSAGTYDPDGDPISYSWAFGNGQGSNAANPQYTYTLPGLFETVLAVSDTAGNVARDTIYVVVAASSDFPTTSVLDDFNRADGPVGSPWVRDVSGVTISGNKLHPISPGFSIIWDGAVYGPNQEAFVTIDPLATNAPEHDLMLKVQGTNENNGRIEVRYDDTANLVAIGTYDPINSWQGTATFPLTLASGDQLGARALQDGTVEVFKNGIMIGSTSITFWPFYAGGGRIGMTLVGAVSSLLDDFGGGDVVLDPNTPPVVTLALPVDSSFFAVDDTVRIVVRATDSQEPSEALTYNIEADLHHNTHIHPNSIVIPDSSGYFIAENHDDGTGVWFEIRGIATDSEGKSDTATVSIFPEIDLTPSGFYADLPQIGDADTPTFTFSIHNQGKMPAPIFHWSFVADGTLLLAEGDTLIAPLDSVMIVRQIPAVLTEGMHVLRIVADTLGAVVETSEVNNAFAGTIIVVAGNGTLAVDGPVRELRLGPAYPNPASGAVGFALALPRESRVSFAVLDVQGREVWRRPDDVLAAGRTHLSWDGRTSRGAPAQPGLYLARVRTQGVTLVRRFVMLR